MRISNCFQTARIKTTGVLVVLLLAGCAAVGPDYAPPTGAGPDTWHTSLKDGLRPDPADPERLAQWWETLDDPVLSDLVRQAVQGNVDVKQALARVREARARRGISQAGLFPTVDATGEIDRRRSSGSSGTGAKIDLYSTGFDAGWEIDVFGGVRRAIEAADADLGASEADLGDVMVSLTAEIGLNYLEARTYQTRLDVADLYPRFRLLGTIGLESLNSADFLQASSRYWSAGSGVAWNIFDVGAIRRNIAAQTAVGEQFRFAYETAVLGALEEVENALTAYAEEQLRRERLLDAADAARKAVDLAQDQYAAGLVDFSNVLDAQRSLLSFQDELAVSDGSVTSNLIGLYKALGGEWAAVSGPKKEIS